MTILIALAAIIAAAASPVPATPPAPLPGQGSLASLITADDYPAAALRGHEEGVVGVRLDIDSRGSVTACTVTASSGSASLDAATCAILQQRARFTPARARNGRPMADSYTQKVAWRIAKPPPPRQGNLAGYVSMDDYPAEALRKGEQGVVEVRLDIDVAGHVSACTVTQSSGSTILDGATCRLLSRRARFSPARDAQGRPVPDSYTQRIAWRLSSNGNLLLESATRVYFACLLQAARQFAATTVAAPTAADKALSACPREERDLLAAFASAPGTGPGGVEQLRGASRRVVAEEIARQRATRGN